MPLSNRTKWSVCLVAPLATLAALEFALRASGAAPPEGAPPIRIWTDDERDAAILRGEATHRFRRGWLWEPRPGAKFTGELVGEHAFRGPKYDVAPRPALRILALGESATFGMGLSEADSWPRRLEARLRERGVDAQVLNFGVIGHSLAQGVERYVREAREWKPDVVVACFGGRNELAEVGAGLDDLGKIAYFDSRWVRARMALDGLATVRWLAAPRRVAADEPEPSGAKTVRHRVSPEEYDALVERLARETARDGAKLAWVIQPYARAHEERAKIIVKYRERIRAILDAHGACIADVHAAVRARERELGGADAGALSLFLDDSHPNAAGERVFAETIERTLIAQGWLERSAK